MQPAAIILPQLLNILCHTPSGECVAIGPEHPLVNQAVHSCRLSWQLLDLPVMRTHSADLASGKIHDISDQFHVPHLSYYTTLQSSLLSRWNCSKSAFSALMYLLPLYPLGLSRKASVWPWQAMSIVMPVRMHHADPA